ncbi:MAG: hypothetical protein HC923_05475 [Myxococcales bacterium]|nr:hypothetical protein [Myxococcales bacterium]
MFVRCTVMLLGLASMACGDDEDPVATVRIENDFDNPGFPAMPPWTICESSYLGVPFGRIARGETSEQREVRPSTDFVLMVAAFDDETCRVENLLPLSSAVEEETFDGQDRTIVIALPNHRGPCPPQGVEPIEESVYERIRSNWPQFGFEPYATRDQNPQCQ